LHRAAVISSVEVVVEFLTKAYPDALRETVTDGGFTLLHLAAGNNSMEVVRFPREVVP
jgi:Ankyrin repeat